MKFDAKSSQFTIKNSLNWAKIKFSIENIRTFRPLTHVNIYFKRMLKNWGSKLFRNARSPQLKDRLNNRTRLSSKKNVPRHDKTNKVSVRPAKTHISLGIRPVWSESSLCAQWVAKDPSFLHADSEDSVIRLGGCPGWSESSLGAHPFCWFWHVVAQIVISMLKMGVQSNCT